MTIIWLTKFLKFYLKTFKFSILQFINYIKSIGLSNVQREKAERGELIGLYGEGGVSRTKPILHSRMEIAVFLAKLVKFKCMDQQSQSTY